MPGNHDWYQRDLTRHSSSSVQAWEAVAPNLQVLEDASWRYEHQGTTCRFSCYGRSQTTATEIAASTWANASARENC